MSTVMAPETIELAESLRKYPAANDANARATQAVPVGVPESLQTMPPNLRVAAHKHEISNLEENVRRLCAELDAAHQEGFGENLYLRSMGGLPRVVMKFADNSFGARVDDRCASCALRYDPPIGFFFMGTPPPLSLPKPAPSSRYAGLSKCGVC
jgi:hypothetical protein